jgi:hypothetical protein
MLHGLLFQAGVDAGSEAEAAAVGSDRKTSEASAASAASDGPALADPAATGIDFTKLRFGQKKLRFGP